MKWAYMTLVQAWLGMIDFNFLYCFVTIIFALFGSFIGLAFLTVNL